MALGMSCDEYDRSAREYPEEETIWAAIGEPYDLNLTLFRYPEPLTLLFTGYLGDVVWDRQPHHEELASIRWGLGSASSASSAAYSQGAVILPGIPLRSGALRPEPCKASCIICDGRRHSNMPRPSRIAGPGQSRPALLTNCANRSRSS